MTATVRRRRRPPDDAEPGRRRAKRSGDSRSVIEWLILIAAALAHRARSSRRSCSRRSTSRRSRWCRRCKMNDRVLVNKLCYKLHDVHRGDIVVFKAPPRRANAGIKDLVKRVIGLPGDDGRVHGRRTSTSTASCSTRATSRRARSRRRRATSPAQVTVPANSYFVMGDNRAVVQGLALLRPDPEGRHRRPRLLPHLAARPTSASCSAGSSRDSARSSPTRRRSRPCGRRGRSRRASMPIAQHRADVAHLLRVPRERRARRSGGRATRGPRSTRCGACSSRRCRARPRSAACRSSGTVDRPPAVECTSLHRAARARSARELGRRSGEHTHSRSSAPCAGATSTQRVRGRRRPSRRPSSS